jgi:hypothetical protein
MVRDKLVRKLLGEVIEVVLKAVAVVPRSSSIGEFGA